MSDRFNRAFELFHHVLQLPDAERAAFLASECGSNDELRREVESLLAHDAQADTGFLAPDAPPSGDATETTPPKATALRAHGPVIEGYEILRELSRGGQGVVYQALQRSTKRKVALKVLLEGPYTSAAAQRRFEREIELIAQLKHPNIIAIFDSGVTPDGRHYYVMDYVRGVPLHQYVRDKQLTLEDTLTLFMTVCEAVQYAHQKGVIHRDLKPTNVLVDAEGHPKVMDFGLAKLLAGPDQTLVSISQAVVGTLPYMSPEQARGNADEIDTRTDVYALGVILYELLTGQYPYPVVGQMMEVLKHITETPPTPPCRRWRADSGVTKRTAKRVRAGTCPIDDEVQTIVLRALAKERERRYPSAGELQRDVGHYLKGEPIEAKKDSGWYVLRKQLRRNRGPVVGTLIFVSLLMATSVSLAFLWQRAVAAEANTESAYLQANHHFVRLLLAHALMTESNHEQSLALIKEASRTARRTGVLSSHNVEISAALLFTLAEATLITDWWIDPDVDQLFSAALATCESALDADRDQLVSLPTGDKLPLRDVVVVSLYEATGTKRTSRQQRLRRALSWVGEDTKIQVPSSRHPLLRASIELALLEETFESMDATVVAGKICQVLAEVSDIKLPGIDEHKVTSIAWSVLESNAEAVQQIVSCLRNYGASPANDYQPLEDGSIHLFNIALLAREQQAEECEHAINEFFVLYENGDFFFGVGPIGVLRICQLLNYLATLNTDDDGKLCRLIIEKLAESVRGASGGKEASYFLNDLAWNISRRKDATLAERAIAMKAAQVALANAHSREANVLSTLGVAQYRTSDYEGALDSLGRSDELRSNVPENLAFIAMALYQLGDHGEACATLDRLREVMADPEQRQSEQSEQFLQEAEALCICQGDEKSNTGAPPGNVEKASKEDP